MRPSQQIGLAHAGADDDGIALKLDPAELVQAHDVDQQLRLGEPHVEHRHQRLAAGEHARVAAFLREHVENLAGRLGAEIIECGWLHRRPPNRPANFASTANNEKPPPNEPPPPALRANAVKNWPMITRVAPSSRRPPMLATLPPMAAS